MMEFLYEIGLTDFDLWLIYWSIGFGGLGGLVKGSSVLKPLMKAPGDAPKFHLKNLWHRTDWLLMWWMHGMLAGFIVGALFTDSITQTFSSFAKIQVLSLIAGYQSPLLFKRLEKGTIDAVIKQAGK